MTHDDDDTTPARAPGPTLQRGWWVALTVEPDAAPLRVYVGVVEDVDEHGVRITLMDWFTGNAAGWDFFAPWPVLQSALVATDEHDASSFGDSAGKWQNRMAGEDAGAFIEVLEERIEAAQDEEERSRLRALREAVGNVGTSVAGSLLSAYLKRVTGMGGA